MCMMQRINKIPANIYLYANHCFLHFIKLFKLCECSTFTVAVNSVQVVGVYLLDWGTLG